MDEPLAALITAIEQGMYREAIKRKKSRAIA
jgi:hypothetical protein